MGKNRLWCHLVDSHFDGCQLTCSILYNLRLTNTAEMAHGPQVAAAVKLQRKDACKWTVSMAAAVRNPTFNGERLNYLRVVKGKVDGWKQHEAYAVRRRTLAAGLFSQIWEFLWRRKIPTWLISSTVSSAEEQSTHAYENHLCHSVWRQQVTWLNMRVYSRRECTYLSVDNLEDYVADDMRAILKREEEGNVLQGGETLTLIPRSSP